MKKSTYLILLFSLLAYAVGQAQDTTSSRGSEKLFSMLKTNRITTGFLIDKVPLSLIPMDSGVVFDTVTSLNAWDQMYFQMLHASTSTFLPSLDTLVSRRNQVYAAHNAIPLLSMYLQYNGIASTALDNGALVWNSDSTSLLDGDSTLNPYYQSEFFMSYPTSSYFGENLRLWVSQEYFFSNVPENTNLNLYIDAHNGQGPQLVPWESVYSVNLPAGERVLTISLRNGDYPLFTHEMVVHVDAYDPNRQAQINSLWNYSVEIQASIPYEGILSKARYDVKYGKDRNGVDHTCIHKPFILVEGIDFGYKNHRIGYYGDGRPQYKYGTLGFIDLLGEGAEYNMEQGIMGSWVPDKLPIFIEGKNFVTQLNEMGYDVIYLDFFDGADKIERNAMALVELINQINTIKCEHEEIVVMGASMGGQVARYALAYMEKNDMPHCTRLYASFDSPHQGAHIPLAIQGMLMSLSGKVEVVRELKNQMLNRPASNQLLVLKSENMTCDKFEFGRNYFNKVDRNAITYSYCNSKSNVLRDSFVFHLNQIGKYPSLTRNVAISCGSGTGVLNDKMKDGAEFFKAVIKGPTSRGKILSKKDRRVDVDIVIEGFAGNGVPLTSQIEGKTKNNTNFIYSTLAKDPAFGNFMTSEIFCKFDKPMSTTIDEVPGGGRNDMSLLKDELSKLLGTKLHDSASGKDVSVEDITFENFGNELFTFIPSVSALDFNTNDLKENIYNALQGKRNIPQPQFHPFEAVYFTPENNIIKNTPKNLPHVFISRDNIGKYGSDRGVVTIAGKQFNTQGNADWGMHEVLINEDIIKGTLPNNNYYTGQPVSFINLGNLSRDVITSCTIGSGGVLQINGNSPISRIKYNLTTQVFEQDPDPGLIPVQGSLFEVSTCNCENPVITIAPDGVIKVGDDNGLNNANNKGILRIRKGAVLQVLGTLKVFNGSKVIIEPGARLEYYPGAKIILQGENAELILQGKLELHNGTEFSILPGLSTKGGHIKAEYNTSNGGEVFTAVGGGHLKLTPAAGSPDQIQLIVYGGPVSVAASVSSVTMDHVIVQLESYSSLKLYNPNVLVQNTLVEGIGTNSQGLMIFGQSNVQIKESTFKNLSSALTVENGYFNQSNPLISKLKFNSCLNGLTYSGRQLQVNQLIFTGCGTGINTSQLTSPGKIEQCVFLQGDNGIVVENTTVGMLYTGNTFSQLQGAAVSTATGGSVFQCNAFTSCGTALYLNSGIVTLSPAKAVNGATGENNTFKNCSIAIQCNGSELYLENGNNNFILSSGVAPYSFLLGKVAYTNLGTGNSLNAQGNYFYPVPGSNNLANATSNWYSLETVYPVNPHPAKVMLSGTTLAAQSTACSGNMDDNSSNVQNGAGLPVVSDVSLLPNPVTTQLNVAYNLLIPNSFITFNVLSSTGTVLLTRTVSGGSMAGSASEVIDVSSLAPGMYYLRITTATQVLYFSFIKI